MTTSEINPYFNGYVFDGTSGVVLTEGNITQPTHAPAKRK
jgi:hypothetical protein